ncbi:MAG: heavy metal-responsive transcriptional regulator [Solirubrobacterales bacterium]|nr:heavy metal-responsive transcriptional regulator [Solirubrobacterales bacterium]
MKSSDTYQVGELAAKSGVTPDTLRYYERLRLLPPPQRTSGGFRVYTAHALDRLRFIRQSQTLGLTLHEIGALVSFQTRADGLGRCREVRDLLRLKLADFETRLAELQDFRNTLSGYLAECERTLSTGSASNADDEPCCPVIETLKAERP